MQLQTIVSRRNDPRDNLAITIGEIEGGPRFNIISDHVVMKGTVRERGKSERSGGNAGLSVFPRSVCTGGYPE